MSTMYTHVCTYCDAVIHLSHMENICPVCGLEGLTVVVEESIEED